MCSLDGLDPNAYQAFQASRNLRNVVDRVTEIRNHNAETKPGGLTKSLAIHATLLTPVLPMLVGTYSQLCLLVSAHVIDVDTNSKS